MSNENYTAHFKEWMIVILSRTKTDTLLQGIDGCNLSGSINILPLRSSKNVVGLDK